VKKKIALIGIGVLLAVAGYIAGTRRSPIALAAAPNQGTVPKSYGRLVTAISDQIGTGLVFEDKDGVIRFVSINGMKEGQLARYDQSPTKGGIPKSYGHLAAAVVNGNQTGLIFEDAEGVIRFVTLRGEVEGELKRD
jgi:hypothetical protein